jgi:hypothetical protein
MRNLMKKFIDPIFGGFASITVLAIWGLVTVGGIYWFWMAIQIGSFLMFVI